MVNTDPFEEFEFKPLTEGLGFHKKAKPMAPAAMGSSSMSSMGPTLPRPPEGLIPPAPTPSSMKPMPSGMGTATIEKPKVRSPLTPGQRRQPPPAMMDDDEGTTVDTILKTLNKKYDFTEDQQIKAQLKAPPAAIWRPDRASFSAIILDTMLVSAGFLGCLMALLMITGADLIGNLLSPDFAAIAGAMALMYATVAWIYLTASRAFMGFTAGEWVIDQRVGSPEILGSSQYTVKVAVRSTFVVLTGFIFSPIISNLFNADWIGQRLRLEILKKS